MTIHGEAILSGSPVAPPLPGTADPPALLLLEQLGICAHLDRLDLQVYNNNVDGYLEDIREVFSWWRSNVRRSFDVEGEYRRRMFLWRDLGGKMSFLLARPFLDNDTGGAILAAQLDFVQNEFLNCTLAFEHMNERDNPNSPIFQGEPGWENEIVEWKVRLDQKRAARPLLQSIPVWGPSLTQGKGSAQLIANRAQAVGLGASNVCDAAAPHPYPGQYMPTTANIAVQEDIYSPLNKPCKVGTEFGYWTPPGDLPDDLQGSYVVRAFPHFFNNGYDHLAIYQLFDLNSASSDPEATMGIFHSDHTPKLAWTYLQRYVSVLGLKQLPQLPAKLNFAVTDFKPTQDCKTLVVQRHDGKHVLIMWRECLIWDRDSKQRITVGEGWTKITGTGRPTADVYRPVTSATPTGISADVDGALWVDLRGDPVMLVL